MIPTVGFNMKKVTRGAVTIKLWDIGGQVNKSFVQGEVFSQGFLVVSAPFSLDVGAVLSRRQRHRLCCGLGGRGQL